ncbi:MAG: DUF2784 domain-containing protein [Gemmatimonadales bacterium]
MLWRLLASLVVLLHGLSILFIVFGGFLTWRWRWLAWVHAPFAVWGVLIEYYGWVCPLTPLENAFRARAGEAGYGGGFIEHYLMPIIYPAGLTPRVQFVLGTLVLVVNLAAYSGFVYRGLKGT